MFKYFICLLARPGRTIKIILESKITYKQIVLFLFWIGLIRGMYEVVRPYLAAGALSQLWLSLRVPSWYAVESVPFLAGCVITAHIRWLIFSLVTFLAAKFFKGRGRFDDYLRVYGVILGIYLVSPLFNALYFFRPAPAVEFVGLAKYSSIIGLGQFVGAGLLLFLTYKVLRQFSGLGRLEAFSIGLLLPLLDRGLYIGFYKLLFSINFIARMELRNIFFAASIMFIVGGLLGIWVMFWLGRYLSQRIDR